MNAEHYAAIVRNHPQCTNPETCVICTLIAEIERLRSGLEMLKRSHRYAFPACRSLDGASRCDCGDAEFNARIDALLGGKG